MLENKGFRGFHFFRLISRDPSFSALTIVLTTGNLQGEAE